MLRRFQFGLLCLGGFIATLLPLTASAQPGWEMRKTPLTTRWDKQVSPTHALPAYPRPQMTRKAWQNLNGLWDYALTDKDAPAPDAYSGKILVPYPWESALSGVAKASVPNQRLWCRRVFSVPLGWKGERILLHFGAVNWDSTVFVNGRQVAAHRGGYDGFDVEITDALKPNENELVVSAWNPVLADNPADQVLGKQRLHPGGIFYTAVTGIWQTVWLEPVPKTYIAGLKLTPDVDRNTVHVSVQGSGETTNTHVEVSVLEGSRTVTRKSGSVEDEVALEIPSAHLWSPADPHLYGLRVRLLQNGKVIDTIDGYFAMRKIGLAKDAQGLTRIFLNNKFLFEVGALDQGYWPDGIYTAPTDEALRFDIEAAKSFGLNLLRKHAKVEPERWYYWADKLGMLVWQDMPQGFAGDGGLISDEGKAQFETEWRREIATHYNHPSIIVWTTFNEGWGQHDTEKIVALTKELDPTRLVNDASGWTDKGVGDIADTHDYPGPGCGKPEENRAAVNGEFGGVTMRVPGHMWTQDVFGYGATLKDSWLVTKRYQELLKAAYRLRDAPGASAVVYTQLTDVEQESNGLMTYDRAIVKPILPILTAANEGGFPPLPPNPNPNTDLLPTSQEQAHIWRFTTETPPLSWMQTDFDDSGWKEAPAPFGQGIAGVRTDWHNGDIWIRRQVTLPSNLPQNLSFLTFHDEDVEIYVNGVFAASAPGYVTDYVTLPITPAGRAALKPGKNVLAVHCHQTTGGQFIDVGITKGN